MSEDKDSYYVRTVPLWWANELVDELVRVHRVLRARKDYAEADALRDFLRARNIVLRVERDGTKWEYV